MTNTEKLISALKNNAIVETGTESVSLDDSKMKYRYDRITLKYEHAANWLVNLFEKAAIENGVSRFATQFFVGDSSIRYQRPKFKGQPNGKIVMSEFVAL